MKKIVYKEGISAIVISKNEGHLLGRCLDQLKEFDEVFVFDMGSKDDTRMVAKDRGITVLRIPKAEVVEKVRQRTLNSISTQWAFFVDPDEVVPIGFYHCLKDFIASNPSKAGIRLRYSDVAFGKKLNHTLRNAAKFSVINVSLTTFPKNAVAHTPPVFMGEAVDAPEYFPLIEHHSYRSIKQSVEKVLRYSESNPCQQELISNPLNIPRTFLREIVVSGAWRDGVPGIAVVFLNTFGKLYAAFLDWDKNGKKQIEPSLILRSTLSLYQLVQPLFIRVQKIARLK